MTRIEILRFASLRWSRIVQSWCSYMLSQINPSTLGHHYHHHHALRVGGGAAIK